MGRVEYPAGKALAPADYVTASEGFTLRANYSYMRRVGGVAAIYLNFQASEAMAADTLYTLGTLDASIYPGTQVLPTTYNVTGKALISRTTGEIKFTPDKAYGANTFFYIYAAYLI